MGPKLELPKVACAVTVPVRGITTVFDDAYAVRVLPHDPPVIPAEPVTCTAYSLLGELNETIKVSPGTYELPIGR
jgi:hypothetical protein